MPQVDLADQVVLTETEAKQVETNEFVKKRFVAAKTEARTARATQMNQERTARKRGRREAGVGKF